MPRRQMFLDVEAFTAKSTERERQTFRCGSLLVVDYRDSNGHRPRENLRTFDTAAELMLAHERMMPTDDMTRKEIEVYYDIDINVWFDWWFRGWRDETEDRELRSKARPPAEDDNHVR